MSALKTGAAGAMVALCVVALVGCAGEAEPSLKEGCDDLLSAYIEVSDSLELIDAGDGEEAALVHLEAAAESLERVRGVLGPTGEFEGVRDRLAETGERLIEGARATVGGAGSNAMGEVLAENQQALLEGARLCGWE